MDAPHWGLSPTLWSDTSFSLNAFLTTLFLIHSGVFSALYVKRRQTRSLYSIFTFTCLTTMYGMKWMGISPMLGPVPVTWILRAMALTSALLFVRRIIRDRRAQPEHPAGPVKTQKPDPSSDTPRAEANFRRVSEFGPNSKRHFMRPYPESDMMLPSGMSEVKGSPAPPNPSNTIDPNRWQTIADFRQDFPQLSHVGDAAIQSLLNLRQSLGGHFSSIQQIEDALNRRQIRGFGPSSWETLSKRLAIPGEKPRPRWAALFSPQINALDFDGIQSEFKDALESLGGPGSRFTLLIPTPIPSLPGSFHQALLHDGYQDNPALRAAAQQLLGQMIHGNTILSQALRSRRIGWSDLADSYQEAGQQPFTTRVCQFIAGISDRYDIQLEFESLSVDTILLFNRLIAQNIEASQALRSGHRVSHTQAGVSQARSTQSLWQTRQNNLFQKQVPSLLSGNRIPICLLHAELSAHAPDTLMDRPGLLLRKTPSGNSLETDLNAALDQGISPDSVLIDQLTHQLALHQLLMRFWPFDQVSAEVWESALRQAVRAVPLGLAIHLFTNNWKGIPGFGLVVHLSRLREAIRQRRHEIPAIARLFRLMQPWHAAEDYRMNYSARLSSPLYGPALRRVLSPWVKKGDIAVDLGAGGGELLEMLGGPIHGETWIEIDEQERMMRLPRGHKVFRVTSDMGRVPLRPSSVTLMTGMNAFSVLTDAQDEMREAYESLLPGGRLVLFQDLIPSPSADVFEALRLGLLPVAHYVEGPMNSFGAFGLRLVPLQLYRAALRRMTGRHPALTRFISQYLENPIPFLDELGRNPEGHEGFQALDQLIDTERIPSQTFNHYGEYTHQRLAATARQAGFEVEYQGPLTQSILETGHRNARGANHVISYFGAHISGIDSALASTDPTAQRKDLHIALLVLRKPGPRLLAPPAPPAAQAPEWNREQAIRTLQRHFAGEIQLTYAELGEVLDVRSRIDQTEMSVVNNRHSIYATEYATEAIFHKGVRPKDLRLAVQALRLSPSDVFYDLGMGYGVVPLYVATVTPVGRVKGIELIASRVQVSSELQKRLGISNVDFLAGNIRDVQYDDGTAFYLYSPFADETLAIVAAELERISRLRSIRIACIGPSIDRLIARGWRGETIPGSSGNVVLFTLGSNKLPATAKDSTPDSRRISDFGPASGRHFMRPDPESDSILSHSSVSGSDALGGKSSLWWYVFNVLYQGPFFDLNVRITPGFSRDQEKTEPFLRIMEKLTEAIRDVLGREPDRPNPEAYPETTELLSWVNYLLSSALPGKQTIDLVFRGIEAWRAYRLGTDSPRAINSPWTDSSQRSAIREQQPRSLLQAA